MEQDIDLDMLKEREEAIKKLEVFCYMLNYDFMHLHRVRSLIGCGKGWGSPSESHTLCSLISYDM